MVVQVALRVVWPRTDGTGSQRVPAVKDALLVDNRGSTVALGPLGEVAGQAVVALAVRFVVSLVLVRRLCGTLNGAAQAVGLLLVKRIQVQLQVEAAFCERVDCVPD